MDGLLTGDFSSPYSSLQSPDGRRELSTNPDYDGLLEVRDVATSNTVARLGRGYYSTWSYSPDGRFVAASLPDLEGSSKWMTLWDLATGQPIRFFDDTADRIGFSPDGLLLVTERDDGTVALWDLRDLVVGLRLVATAQGRELRWQRGRLQEADSITGPWRDLWTASSPLPLEGQSDRRFYRVLAH